MENPSSSRFHININPRNWKAGEFLIFLFVMLFLGLVVSLSLSQVRREKSTQPSPTTAPQKQTFLSPHTLVYGIWTENNSIIKAYDLSTGGEYILAELPKNIKKVTVLSPTELLYVNNTNERDHGTEVVVYNMENKTTRILYKASNGFGIDDYVVSSNKRYLADWEVRFNEGTKRLRAGRSRVYSLDIHNPQQQYLIYDEPANQPVHYPRAITSTGEIYLDTFLPNSGAGWAYGMSVSDFGGSQKQNLQNMQNGTYGTQPVLSQDNHYLVFAGYDGSRGDGKESVGGVRQALFSPNSVDLLDTVTKSRERLPNLPNSYTYPFVGWDREEQSILFARTLPHQANAIEFFRYNITSQRAEKINLGGETSNGNFPISSLSTEKILFAKLNKQLLTVGNLGDTYARSVNSFFIVNTAPSSTAQLVLSDPLVQFITLTPSSFFSKALLVDVDSTTKKQLQLQTFTVKPSLAPARLAQQSLPEAEPLQPQPEQPQQDGIPETQPEPQQQSQQTTGSNPEFEAQAAHLASIGMLDSPLYLYGREGTKVRVLINTPVFSSSPIYGGGYSIALLENGKIEVNGNIYERIEYDYMPAKKALPPTYGTITSRENLNSTLSFYTKSLGLNEKEIKDLIEEVAQKIDSPYVFVSFFDQKTSKAILPLSFNPQPDTYINIVFYFKEFDKKPSFTPQSPVFPQIKPRGEFTAVEVSWTIEK